MKRVLSLLLCLVLMLSVVAPVTAQAYDNGAVYIQNDDLTNAIVGEDIHFENVVMDDRVIGSTPTLPQTATEDVTSPIFAEADEAEVCNCEACATIAEHTNGCVVKAKYHKLCVGTAESLLEQWSGFTADEQTYMLQYMKENLSGRYDDFIKLLNAPTGSASETYVDGTVVSVEGIPEDSELIIQPADTEIKKLAETHIAGQADKTTELFCYDVSVEDEKGAQWQPDGTVRMELDMPGVKLHKNTRVYVVHVDDNGVASTIDAEVIADGRIAFVTPGFSTFAGFTVDFEFEGIQFSIPGKSSITLTEIFEKLEIPLYAEDVVDVVFSDPSLIRVEKQAEGEWLLTSLKAFTTTESLKLTMADGEVYDITVTDATYPTICWNDNVNEDDNYNGAEDWELTTYRTNNYIDNSHTEDYDIRVDGTYASDKTFQIVLQRPEGATGKILYLDLHTVKVQGGANLIIRLGGTITNENTTKVVISQVPGYINDTPGYGYSIGELFWVEDGSLEIRPSYEDQSDVRIEIDVQSGSRNGEYGDNKAFVSLRKYADYFIADQCDFINNPASSIMCRANNLSAFTMTDCNFGKIDAEGTISEICYNSAGQGGAIYIHNTVEDNETSIVDIENMTLTNVDFNGTYCASGRGGAILNRGRIGTQMLLEGCDFTGTYSQSSHGGAIEISNNDVGMAQGAIVIRDCVFTGTEAKGARGGCIRMVSESCQSFTISGCTFTDCAAYSHGGVFAIQGAVSAVSVSGSTFTNCKALNNRGGGINIEATCSSFEISDCSFINCTAGSHGGCIDLQGDVGSFTATNTTFTNGQANNRGGAIRIYGNCGPFKLNNCQLSGCTSNSPGGGVSMEGTVGNFTVENGCSISNGSAGSRGGAIAVKCSKVGNITLSNSSFTNNTAGTIGGAVHFGINSEATAPITVGDVTVDGCTFSGNRSNGVGGCLSLTDGTYNSVTIQNSSFSDSYATNYGGAIGLKTYADDATEKFPFKINGALNIFDCSFTNCSSGALNPEGIDTDGDGEADKFTWNHDGDPETEEITRLNGTGGGGAITIGGEIVTGITIKSTNKDKYSNFTNCYTWNNGGAICFIGTVKTPRVDLQYLDINGCRARDAGGAIYLSNAIVDDLKMDTCTVQNCSYFTPDFDIDIPGTDYDALGKDTYAAYDASGTFRCIGNTTCRAWIYNCTYKNNVSYSNGGGVYWNANNIRIGAGGTRIEPSLKLQASMFDGNYADRDGGALYVEATVNVVGCVFKNNNVGGRGGAIAQQVYNNEARTLGEGEATNLVLDPNTSIYENTAVHGGGISITVSSTVSVPDGTDVIYPVKFELRGASVYGNKAKQNGGGIYYATTTYEDPVVQKEVDNFEKEILINNGKIYGNIAGYSEEGATEKGSGNGGGIYMASNQFNTEDSGYSKITISEGSIYNNSANRGNGGGVYLTGENALCTVTGGTIGFYLDAKNNNAHVILPNYATPKETTDPTGVGVVYSEGNGGGIAIYSKARIEMTGGSICYNEAYVGGGIAVRNGSSMLSDKAFDGTAALIDNNTATSAGGGIAVHDNSTMTINDGQVTNNHAAYGGAISVLGSGDKATIGTENEIFGMIFNGGRMTNNVAAMLGGAICLSDNSTMKLNGGQIESNYAAKENASGEYTYSSDNEGGGVAVCQGSQMDIYGGTIKNNKAYNGAGLVVRGNSILKMYPVVNAAEAQTKASPDGVISKNNAYGLNCKGGGIYAVASDVFMYGGEIVDNNAEMGGGMYIAANSKGTIDGGKIMRNVAKSGGGIYIMGINGQTPGNYTTKLDVVGGSISYNTATGTGQYNGQGGGIHADRCVEIVISGKEDSNEVGDISYNTASRGGGVYLCWGAHLTVVNGHIVYNKAVGRNNSYTTTNMKNHGLLGVGGGVCVTSGYSEDIPTVFTLRGGESGANIAIYGNTADFAADDVFSNAERTQLNLPLVGEMNLTGYPLPAVGWVEDYPTNDTEYTKGLAHGTEKGITDGKNVYRYRFADAYHRILVPEQNTAGVELPLDEFTPNIRDAYACLTLGMPSAISDTVVIDYGLPVQIDVKSNDIGLTDVTVLEQLGALRPVVTGSQVDYSEGSLDQQWSTNPGCEFGTVAIENEKVLYTPNTLAMYNKDSFSYALKYTRGTGADATDFYFYSSVTVIPATSIYYEDNFTDADGKNNIEYTVYKLTEDEEGNVTETLDKSTDDGVQWAPEGSDPGQQYQQEDRPGNPGGTDYDNVYGYDAAYDNIWPYYSLNESMKVTVKEGKTAKAKFTFKGRGFDILAVTNNISGTILVTVDRIDDTTTPNKYVMVDTYYGYTYDAENNKWSVDTQFNDASAHLYQIPVIKVEGLAYGEYAVEVCLAYDKMFDHRNLGYYSFYLDGVRIYDPADDGVIVNGTGENAVKDTTIRDAYIADGEYLPTYYEIRDLLLEKESLSSEETTGAVFVDGIDSVGDASIKQYKHYGPNNEVYLGRGQAIAFTLNYSDNVAGVHMGMKRLLDSTSVSIYTYENGQKKEFLNKTLNSTSELYFDISELNGKTIVIENTGTDENLSQVIALTNLKVTTAVTSGVSGEIPVNMDSKTAARVLNYLNDVEPVISLKYPTLSFESEINYNIYFGIEGADVALENMGLITFTSAMENGTITDAAEVISGVTAEGDLFAARSNGIAAKKLGDTLYFKVYAKLADGSYVYSKLASYSAANYAGSILGKADSGDALKSLVTAMLHYGTAAQKFFSYNTDSLLIDTVADEWKVDIADYSADMLVGASPADTDRAGAFLYNGGYTKRYPNVSFEGAFAINYHFLPAYEADGPVMVYFWDRETYDSVETLTVDNALCSVEAVRNNDGEYVASYTGVAAKDIDETVYVSAVYESEGTVYASGVLPYSVGAYCADRAVSGGADMQVFAKATAVYSWYAKSYFANA